MNRIIIATKNEQILTLLRYLLHDEQRKISVDIVVNPILQELLKITCDRELLLIDVDQIEGNTEWIPFIRKRKKMKVLLHFNNSKRSVLLKLIHDFKKNKIHNSMEFIILDNYSIELKLILIRQEILELFSSKLNDYD